MTRTEGDSMISMDKQYRTRDGREVELFAIRDGRVYGRECNNGDWICNSWSLDNIAPYLIEMKPKITRTYWLAHYPEGPSAWPHELDHKNAASGCIAITGPHIVEFTEGEGL